MNLPRQQQVTARDNVKTLRRWLIIAFLSSTLALSALLTIDQAAMTTQN